MLLYNCPSEKIKYTQLYIRIQKQLLMQYYLVPPCFKFEIYEGEQQSINNFETYTEWLNGYWKPTLEICEDVMKEMQNLDLLFVIMLITLDTIICYHNDLTKSAEEIFGKTKEYKIKLTQMKTKRSPKKLAMGNYETLCVYEKG